MSSGYMVLARDGIEYGPLDRDTIQQWYFEGRIDRNSKVWEPGKDKFKLHEMFDLTLWRAALVNTAPPGAAPTLSFQPKTMADAMAQENERTPGMLAAGILLAINGVLGLLTIAVLLLFKLGSPDEPRAFVVPIVDLIVAVGLLRGKERFRNWGLVRAVLGIGFALLAALVSTVASVPKSAISGISLTTVSGWIALVFQLMFCVGIAALLWGDWPSKARVGIGIAAVLVAWSGIFTAYVVSEIVGSFKEEAELAKYSVAAANFVDFRLGVSAKLPEGWALLAKENPITSVPDAAMIAVHKGSNCFAALLVEPDVMGGASPDGYLTLVLQNRQKATPSIKETGRVDVDFGGHEGRRLDTSWTINGMNFRGFSTACKAGHSYYLLTGWCLDQSLAKALPAYQSLAAVFEVGPRDATGPTEIAWESNEDFYELEFFIQEKKRLADGSQTILARGLHEGAEVGFELSLGSKWREGSFGPDVALVTYTGTASCRSVGPESDSLLQALDQLYETNQSPTKMNSETRFSALSLEGDPRDLEKRPVKLKLFFESAAEDRYAELFVNIDLKARKLFINEKDPEYRGAIIRALQGR